MNGTSPTPPVAPREPHTTRIHSTELHDDYAWLRDKSSPQVRSYLEAENAWTADFMRPTEPLQQQLYDEILSHIKEDDVSVPYGYGAWEYLTRTEIGKQYPRECRYPIGHPESEQTILDVNELAEGQPFMAVAAQSISPDGNLLAYTTDNTGFRQYTLHVKDLTTGTLLPDTAERVTSLTWAADSGTLFFTTEDEQTKRSDRLFRLTLKEGSQADKNSLPTNCHPEQREGSASGSEHRNSVRTTDTTEEVFHEPDERFNLAVGRTRDRQFLLLQAGSHTTSETWFLNAATPQETFRLFAPRVDDEEYDIDHRNSLWYVRTNHKAEQFRLMQAPVSPDLTGRDSWQEILPENPTAPLQDFDLFTSFLIATYREAGLPVLRVFNFDENNTLTQPRDIRFPDPAYEAYGSTNPDPATANYRYAYQSLARPASVFDYDVATGESRLLKEQEVPGGFDSSRYLSERLTFAAEDGTQIPISLVYRRDLICKDAPLYVYGYGSYGYALPLTFRPSRLSLLDRGVVLAYAHIRGGGELGDPWHDAGKMMLKRNTFTDFIAAVEFLTHSGYGSPGRVAIEGGSAGGLLLGAVVNLAAEADKPNLFRAVLSHVPFVDVINTMLDATLPLTVAEYEEWGNPNQQPAFDYILSYSPYDNLRAGPYPAMLVKTSLNDSQVMYWEPAKYIARLRTLKSNPETPLLLHINMEAGHGGASGRYDAIRELAFDQAFLLRELGVERTDD